MGFASGPVSFQRFFVSGKLPGEIDDQFVAKLNDHAFGKLATLEDNTQLGWVGPGHLFETEIAAERIACGRFAYLAVRVDKQKVPPSLLRAYVRMEEETALAASGREFLSRGAKREAKETALLRAEQELKSGAFRQMAMHHVLLDLELGRLYLSNLSAGVADRLMPLFADTFGAALEPTDAEIVARKICEANGRGRTLDGVAPIRLVKPPLDSDDTAGVIATDLKFLGKELLTWLWHGADAATGPLTVRGNNDVTVMLDRMLRLKCDFNLTGTDVITADGPTALPEARAAIRVGKQPDKAGLVIDSPLGEFRLTLEGPRFTVSGLVLPEDEQDADARVRLEQRFELIADAANLLDAIFELFLLKRTARAWRDELRTMSAWATGADTDKLIRAASA